MTAGSPGTRSCMIVLYTTSATSKTLVANFRTYQYYGQIRKQCQISDIISSFIQRYENCKTQIQVDLNCFQELFQ